VAWNQPGGAGDRDPWGKRKPEAQKFNPEQVLRRLNKRIRDVFGMRGDDQTGGGGAGIALVLVVVVAIWALSGFYILQQGERGVVLTFGRKSEAAEAGLHWRWPYPIQRVEKVNVEKISSIPIGYRVSARSGARSAMPKEALMLTQDENIVDVQLSVQVKVNDAEAYLFNVVDPDATIAQATESAVRETMMRTRLDVALTDAGRGEIARAAQESLRRTLDRYRLGVTIVAIEKPTVQPPEDVKSAFDEMAKVDRDVQGLKSEAQAYAADIIPRARATVARQVQEAEGYKASTVTRAEGDTRRFTQIANEYLKAPAITRERLYIETMEQVLSNTTKVLVDQKGGNNVIYLPLDKLVPATDATGAALPGEAESTAPKGVPNPRGRGDQRNRRTVP